MERMATAHLRLRKCRDGYYRTSWVDDRGDPHAKSFGKIRNKALNRFNEFHVKWKTNIRVRNPYLAERLSIRKAWERFKTHANAYYRHADGTPTGEALNIEDAMRQVFELYGEIPVEEFGPKALKVARERMIEDDLCINVINQRVRKIRHVFKWLASEELVPASIWHGLQTVQALRAGKTYARATDPVLPVPEPHVWVVCEHVPPTIRAMIELQYHTGMRPGEVCTMRPVDLDTTGKVWMYQARVKGTRIVLLGPKAQEIVRPFLQRDMMAYLFSPRDAMSQRYATRPTHRHQPVLSPATTRKIGDKYDPKAYGYCIRRICDVLGIPRWSPNQLRHNAATRLRRERGLDIAQIILGHIHADTTEIYAEAELKRALAIV